MPANPNYSEENIAKALKSLLNENVDITAAALAYRLGAPRSTITRSSERLAAVEAAVEEQRKIRAVVADNKSSNEALIAKLVRREKTIATLERRIEILTASHSAMLMAVGEIGGVAAWRKFSRSGKPFELNWKRWAPRISLTRILRRNSATTRFWSVQHRVVRKTD